MKRRRPAIELSDDEHQALQRLVNSDTVDPRVAERARIILATSEGVSSEQLAYQLNHHPYTILYWRRRFLERRSEGIPACLQNLRPSRRR